MAYGMADSLWMRLREIPWDKYPCHPGTAKKAPKMLENLASRKGPRAMKASHELWAALCAGGLAPAAVPVIPFLVEIMGISSADLKPEILDIILKCLRESAESDNQERHEIILKTICHNRAVFEQLSRSRKPMIADKAELILSECS